MTLTLKNAAKGRVVCSCDVLSKQKKKNSSLIFSVPLVVLEIEEYVEGEKIARFLFVGLAESARN